MAMEFKDMWGNPIKVGDNVVFVASAFKNCSTLCRGKVVELITPKSDSEYAEKKVLLVDVEVNKPFAETSYFEPKKEIRKSCRLVSKMN